MIRTAGAILVWATLVVVAALMFVYAATADAKDRLTATCSRFSDTRLNCTVWLDVTVKRPTTATVWTDGYTLGAGPRWLTRRVRLERGRNELGVRMAARRYEYEPARIGPAGPVFQSLTPGPVDSAFVGLRIGGTDLFDPKEVTP